VEKQRGFLEKSQNAFGAVGRCGFVGQQLRLYATIFVPTSQKIFASIRQPVKDRFSIRQSEWFAYKG
jgi:hypothetical protein